MAIERDILGMKVIKPKRAKKAAPKAKAVAPKVSAARKAEAARKKVVLKAHAKLDKLGYFGNKLSLFGK